MKIKLIVFILLLVLATCSSAATYYVSQLGSDSASGSVTAPWLTVRKAITAAAIGDTIILANGVYNEIVNTNYALTVSTNNLSIRAENRWGAIVRINGATCSRVFYLNASNLILDGLVIDAKGPVDSCEVGVFISSGTSNQTLNDLWIRNASLIGVDIDTTGTTLAANAVSITNSLFTGVDNEVISLSGAFSNNTNISNNIINVGVSATDVGISSTQTTAPAAHNLTISNNSFIPVARDLFTATAVAIYGGTRGVGLINSKLTENTFGSATQPWNGTILRTRKVTGLNFSNNSLFFKSYTQNAIFLEQESNDTIISDNHFCDSENYCDSPNGYLLNADSALNLNVSNNLFYINRISYWLYLQSKYAAITNATILNNTYVGLNSSSTRLIGVNSDTLSVNKTSVDIENNSILLAVDSTASAYCLFASNLIAGVISGNTFNGCKYGAAFKYSAAVNVTNNSILNVAGVGIIETGSSQFKVTKNSIITSSGATYAIQSDGDMTRNSANNTWLENKIDISASNTTSAMFIGSKAYATTSDFNEFIFQFRSYPRAFSNGSYFNFNQWNNRKNLEVNSVFYPVNLVDLSLVPSVYFNGPSWTFTSTFEGVKIANATLYINYSNGTNYVTLQNASNLDAGAVGVFDELITFHDSLTAQACAFDVNGFQACSGVVSFSSDLLAPQLTIFNSTFVNYSTYTTFDFELQTIATDADSGIYVCDYSLNGLAPINYSCDYSFNFTAFEGSNNLTIRAFDQLGNFVTNLVIFDVDTSAPVINVTLPLESEKYNMFVNLTAHIEDVNNVTNVTFIISNSTSVYEFEASQINESYEWSYLVNTSNFQDGAYNVSIYAQDYLNNANYSPNISFHVLNAAPQFFNLKLFEISNNSVAVIWYSNVASNAAMKIWNGDMSYDYTNNEYEVVHFFFLDDLTPNIIYTYNFTGCDYLNNCNYSQSYNFTIVSFSESISSNTTSPGSSSSSSGSNGGGSSASVQGVVKVASGAINTTSLVDNLNDSNISENVIASALANTKKEINSKSVYQEKSSIQEKESKLGDSVQFNFSSGEIIIVISLMLTAGYAYFTRFFRI